DITISTAGIYTVTVADANGCTASTTKELNVNDSPVATITGTEIICAGESSVFTAIGGGTYEWNTNDQTASINVNTSGIYTVTITDASGCKSIGTKTLTVNPNPTATITGADEICSGATTVWTASGGTNYSWSNL